MKYNHLKAQRTAIQAGAIFHTTNGDYPIDLRAKATGDLIVDGMSSLIVVPDELSILISPESSMDGKGVYARTDHEITEEVYKSLCTKYQVAIQVHPFYSPIAEPSPNSTLINTEWDDILKEALEKYGREAQLEMALEELLELGVELQKLKRNKSNYEKITEETADVLIMALQLRYMLGPAAVDLVIRQKLDRLKERMGGYGKGY